LGDKKTGRREGEPKRQYKLLHGISFDGVVEKSNREK